MLNNKGQSLILFIIVLPVVLFILVLVIDIGKVLVLRQELNNISEIVLDYGLDKLDMDDNSSDNTSSDIDDSNYNLEDELIEVIKLNKSDIDKIDVRIDNDRIYVDLSKGEKGIFSSLVDISIFNVKSSYVGYFDNNKKRIERVRGD